MLVLALVLVLVLVLAMLTERTNSIRKKDHVQLSIFLPLSR
jgi:hypothetical protein